MACASFAILSPKPNLLITPRESSNSLVTSLTTCHLPRLFHSHSRRIHICKATSSSSSPSSITEFDLYDLLGIESSSDQTTIKTAYRSLQKRCHPDIAGPAGHDMAIILNEAYAVLSDPLSRSAYDKEQAKSMELQGYTGRPLYSAWMGSETERRAVFVDEVKCVGCLKCALFADKTFAIESVYGRARVIAQWADPEHKIQESIDACPVNCISMVERADLAALEFLMSKQPRERVRIGASNTGGKRVFDVFSEVKVLHKRLEEAKQGKSHVDSKVTFLVPLTSLFPKVQLIDCDKDTNAFQYSTLQRDARISVIQAIRSISNWLYWKPPGLELDNSLDLLFKGSNRCSQPEINKLRDAATARRNAMLQTGGNTRLLPRATSKDEYWTPTTLIGRVQTSNKSSPRPTISHPPLSEAERKLSDRTYVKKDIEHRSPFVSGIPIGLFIIAASVVKMHESGKAIGGLEEHIGGSVALQVVNSPWLQVLLAGATWYFVGIAVIHLVEGLARKS